LKGGREAIGVSRPTKECLDILDDVFWCSFGEVAKVHILLQHIELTYSGLIKNSLCINQNYLSNNDCSVIIVVEIVPRLISATCPLFLTTTIRC
jgi:hypothetical protein